MAAIHSAFEWVISLMLCKYSTATRKASRIPKMPGARDAIICFVSVATFVKLDGVKKQ